MEVQYTFQLGRNVIDCIGFNFRGAYADFKVNDKIYKNIHCVGHQIHEYKNQLRYAKKMGVWGYGEFIIKPGQDLYLK